MLKKKIKNLIATLWGFFAVFLSTCMHIVLKDVGICALSQNVIAETLLKGICKSREKTESLMN